MTMTMTLDLLLGQRQMHFPITNHGKHNENYPSHDTSFETGLCVLMSSSANVKPQALKESQFPVFTIYSQKVCLSGQCDFFYTFILSL